MPAEMSTRIPSPKIRWRDTRPSLTAIVSSTGIRLSRSYRCPNTTISGVITWNDANDKDGIRPDGVTVKLYADGQLKEEKLVEPDRNGEWKYSFTGLDKSVPNKTNIQYTIAEEPVEGYTTTINGWNITNTHAPKTDSDHPTDSGKTDLAGAIVWDDQNDKDGIRPVEVTVNLLRNGMKVGSITVREADGWSWMFEGQAKADTNGNAYTYTFTEDEVEGYETTVDGGIITNTHTPAEGDEEHDPMLYIQGEIFWVDDNDAEGKRPDSVDVTLYLQGQAVQTVTVTEGSDGRWLYEMDPVKRFYIQENTRARLMASGAKMKAASDRSAQEIELQYSLRQADVPEYKWKASLKSVEMPNRDVIATADFTDTLIRAALPTPSGTPNLTPTPGGSGSGSGSGGGSGSGSGSSWSGTSNYSGGSTVHIGGNTISNGSVTTAGGTTTTGDGDITSSSTSHARSTVSDGSKTSSVKTGDESNPMMLMMLMLMAAGMCVVLLYVRRRRGKQQ